jgi:hypothetical protein
MASLGLFWNNGWTIVNARKMIHSLKQGRLAGWLPGRLLRKALRELKALSAVELRSLSSTIVGGSSLESPEAMIEDAPTISNDDAGKLKKA